MSKVVITITDVEVTEENRENLNITFEFEPAVRKDTELSDAQFLAYRILEFMKKEKKESKKK